jgi:anaerobic magnesium-protoporphyrin IX monomethyl ester cyclase
MRILIINPPHPSIGSRIPREQLPPLGLLSIGGPLIDAGHAVSLIDAELGPMRLDAIVAEAVARTPDAILLGHSGSTSAHPIVRDLTCALRAVLPDAWIIYGGVFPTYHWREILGDEPQIDVIVRGEGEETAPRLVAALAHVPAKAGPGPDPGWTPVRRQGHAPMRERGRPLLAVRGIAFRDKGVVIGTPPAPMIADLDACRVGWELIDPARYGYWGGKRSVVMQFSRGCPHPCNYCGQRGFWTRFRHRDPKKFAAEIAWLHREHGVELINFADENPTASRKAWRAFLEALIAENIDISLVASTRADDIVRDADILHLYKQAGFERFLMGMENTDEATLRLIRKGGGTVKDREAIRLLRRHDILSLATWVVGFEEETARDLLRGLRQLISYDPDQITALYVTPHRWTPFFRIAAQRKVIQTDQRRWDYKHQVLATRHLRPWQLIAWVKLIEVIVQLRPRALRRYIWHRDRKIRHGIRWYYRMGRRVWFHEIWNFLMRDSRARNGPTLVEFWGAPQDAEEEAMHVRTRGRSIAPAPARRVSA